MPSAKMRKLSLVMARSDAESVLRGLLALGCVESARPDELPCFAITGESVSREVFKLSELGANQAAIVLIGTQNTLMLAGWLPSRSEPPLVSMLSQHTCAWEIEDPTPDEADLAPVKLVLPGFFGKLRSGGRRLFSPLANGATKSEQRVSEE